MLGERPCSEDYAFHVANARGHRFCTCLSFDQWVSGPEVIPKLVNEFRWVLSRFLFNKINCYIYIYICSVCALVCLFCVCKVSRLMHIDISMICDQYLLNVFFVIFVVLLYSKRKHVRLPYIKHL